jgi:hypothetical protein
LIAPNDLSLNRRNNSVPWEAFVYIIGKKSKTKYSTLEWPTSLICSHAGSKRVEQKSLTFGELTKEGTDVPRLDKSGEHKTNTDE